MINLETTICYFCDAKLEVINKLNSILKFCQCGTFHKFEIYLNKNAIESQYILLSKDSYSIILKNDELSFSYNYNILNLSSQDCEFKFTHIKNINLSNMNFSSFEDLINKINLIKTFS